MRSISVKVSYVRSKNLKIEDRISNGGKLLKKKKEKKKKFSSPSI